MRPLLVHLLNCLWLVLSLIGIPAATSMSLGGLRISKVTLTGPLILLMLMSMSGFNLILLLLAKKRPIKKAVLPWCFLSLALSAVYAAFFFGHIHFLWLKEWLIQFNTLYNGTFPADK